MTKKTERPSLAAWPIRLRDSRYIERAENNARIAEVNLQLLLDLANQPQSDMQQQWNPIISSLEETELFASLYATPDGAAAIDFVSLQEKNPNSILSCLTEARENARHGEQCRARCGANHRLYLLSKRPAGLCGRVRTIF